MRALSGRPLSGRLLAGHSPAQRPAGTPDQYPYGNPEARAVTARFSVQPSISRKGLVDTLVGGLKDAGVWAKLDALYVLAAHDAQAARQNWIANAYNLTTAGATPPTFTADAGYQGDGASSDAGRLLTGFVPSAAAGAKMLQNSASAFNYSLTAAASAATSQIDMGTTNSGVGRIFLRNRNSDNGTRWAISDQTVSTQAATASGAGLFMADRSGATTKSLYIDGSLVLSQSIASDGLSASQIGILAPGNGANGGARQIAAAGFGSSLSSDENAALYSALNAYLTAVGAV